MLTHSTSPSFPCLCSFSVAHKHYVQSLYRRTLRDSLNWCIRRDIWRDRAIEIRAEFERNRNIRNPRELAKVLDEAETRLKERAHPDPYKREYRERTTERSENSAQVVLDLIIPTGVRALRFVSRAERYPIRICRLVIYLPSLALSWRSRIFKELVLGSTS